jgi:hypothetical protein
MEVKRAETIGNEIQDSEAEGLEGREDGGAHSPARRAKGNSNEPKRIISHKLMRLEVSKMKAI